MEKSIKGPCVSYFEGLHRGPTETFQGLKTNILKKLGGSMFGGGSGTCIGWLGDILGRCWNMFDLGGCLEDIPNVLGADNNKCKTSMKQRLGLLKLKLLADRL